MKYQLFSCCLLAIALTACGSSKSNKAKTEKEEVRTEVVETSTNEERINSDETNKINEQQLAEDPIALADFTINCIKNGHKKRLLPYATQEYNKTLWEEIDFENEIKNSKPFKKACEQLRATTFTRIEITDIGSTIKRIRYKSNPAHNNLKVLIMKEKGKWLIDDVATEL